MSTDAIRGAGAMLVPTSGAIKSTRTQYDSVAKCAKCLLQRPPATQISRLLGDRKCNIFSLVS